MPNLSSTNAQGIDDNNQEFLEYQRGRLLSHKGLFEAAEYWAEQARITANETDYYDTQNETVDAGGSAPLIQPLIRDLNYRSSDLGWRVPVFIVGGALLGMGCIALALWANVRVQQRRAQSDHSDNVMLSYGSIGGEERDGQAGILSEMAEENVDEYAPALRA